MRLDPDSHRVLPQVRSIDKELRTGSGPETLVKKTRRADVHVKSFSRTLTYTIHRSEKRRVRSGAFTVLTVRLVSSRLGNEQFKNFIHTVSLSSTCPTRT